jgi:hypothetical protein
VNTLGKPNYLTALRLKAFNRATFTLAASGVALISIFLGSAQTATAATKGSAKSPIKLTPAQIKTLQTQELNYFNNAGNILFIASKKAKCDYQKSNNYFTSQFTDFSLQYGLAQTSAKPIPLNTEKDSVIFLAAYKKTVDAAVAATLKAMSNKCKLG